MHWQHCSGDLTKWLRSAEGKPVLLVSSEVQTCVVTCGTSLRGCRTTVQLSCAAVKTSPFQSAGKQKLEPRMGHEREEVDAVEQAKAKVEERLYRVTVIERILASKGEIMKSQFLFFYSPLRRKFDFVITQKCGKRKERCWSLNSRPCDITWEKQRQQLRWDLLEQTWQFQFLHFYQNRFCKGGSRDTRSRSPPWSRFSASASLVSTGSSSWSMMSISQTHGSSLILSRLTLSMDFDPTAVLFTKFTWLLCSSQSLSELLLIFTNQSHYCCHIVNLYAAPCELFHNCSLFLDLGPLSDRYSCSV